MPSKIRIDKPPPIPPKLQTENEIMASWKGDIGKPLVSIWCITFNHEPYIKDALNGFTMQETDFPFEIILHDDASTDKTVEIIREYEGKYPKLIKPKYQMENQYSQGVTPLSILPALSSGKYIAICEGDDYWTDPLKLQKQFDFMENNDDCSICGHSYIYNDERRTLSSRQVIKHPLKKFNLIEYLEGDLSRKFYFRTLTMMYRKSAIDKFPETLKKAKYGDMILHVLCLEKGYGAFLDDVMGFYRVHAGGMTQQNPKQFIQYGIELRQIISEYLGNDYSAIINSSIESHKKKLDYCKVLDKYDDEEAGGLLLKFLERNNYKSLAIYGAGRLCNRIIQLIKDKDIKIEFLIDNKIASFPGYEVFDIDKLASSRGANAIMVTPTYDFDKIRETLLKKVGDNAAIFSASDIFIDD